MFVIFLSGFEELLYGDGKVVINLIFMEGVLLVLCWIIRFVSDLVLICWFIEFFILVLFCRWLEFWMVDI